MRYIWEASDVKGGVLVAHPTSAANNKHMIIVRTSCYGLVSLADGAVLIHWLNGHDMAGRLTAGAYAPHQPSAATLCDDFGRAGGR